MSNRRITIVGAGQSGLQLGLGLLKRGRRVRMVSNRTPEEIAAGRVASSQCMFATPLAYEREMGVDDWADAPPVDGIGFTLASPDSPGGKAFSWAARLDAPAQSIDQRVKFPQLIEEFVAQGGEMVYEDAGVEELERHTQEDELVIVAAGKGDIVRLFERDDERSTYDKPRRALALTYVHGLREHDDFSRVSFNLMPGIGEYFVFPALTLSGDCHIMVFEGIPGGPLDRFQGLGPQEHFDASIEFLREYLTWEAERAVDATLTDDQGVLAGRFPPTVRKPVMTLPSGRTVLGMADVVVLNDPITGQGSNNASRCAWEYYNSILERGDGTYDDAWKQDTFERYWAVAEPVARWTNTLLAPPEPHHAAVLGAADGRAGIATRFANGFDHPADFSEWFLDADGAARLLAASPAPAPAEPSAA